MTTSERKIAKYVPELSFIDKEYKFGIYKTVIGKRCKTERALLSKDYLTLGKTKLPLNMKNLDRIKTYYEDGLVDMVSVAFLAKGFSYDILHTKNSFAMISAYKNLNNRNQVLFSGSVEKPAEVAR